MTDKHNIQLKNSFLEFLFKNKRNKTILLFTGVAIVLQFVIFKYFYPIASFIHGDSFSYLNAAENNQNINIYLIGYSKFLRLVSVFTKSDFVLTAFQYFFIESSVVFLLFTIYFLYPAGRLMQIILTCFMVLNPLFLHLGNLISSDGFFLSISMVWFTLLLWMIHHPSKKILFLQVVFMFIAFTVRYNAIIYPIISAFAIWLSKLPLKRKLLYIVSGIIPCALFTIFTCVEYKKLTGYWQYSPFSGWQLANNAMYTYRYVDSASRNPVPKQYQALDNMIRKYFHITRDTSKYIIEKAQASTFYMWSPQLPLMRYRDSLFKHDTVASELKKWASVGPLYKSYGLHIIKQYPVHFGKYFLWPNANKYFAPPVEFLEEYNSGKVDVTEQAQKWFEYKSRNIKSRFKSKRVWILDFYPIFTGAINVLMLCTLLCYLILKGWQSNKVFNKGIVLASVVWLLNAGFTIFASSVALRFQAFPIMITTIFSALILDWMINTMHRSKEIKFSQQIKAELA